jgi:hypothetical protein
MSNATSLVGTWSGFVSWGDAGPPVSNGWIQVEGLAAWNFTDNDEPAGLIYTGNVTRNAIEGLWDTPTLDRPPARGPSMQCESRPRVQPPRWLRQAMI